MSKNNSLSVKIAYFLTGSVFLGFVGWWICNHVTLTSEDGANALLADTQWVLALIGGIIGIWAAQKWGGLKSVFGKSIFLLSAGLLAQVFGQVVYTYYARVQHIEAPYPSIGDIGFFGSVILYIVAIFFLIKALSTKNTFTSKINLLWVVLVPAALLIGSYLFFLNGYETCFEDAETLEIVCNSRLTTILDFAYPLGQAGYVSLAILTYFISRGLLGGIMKKRILLLLAALLVQYAADYSFLYTFNRETWYPGGFSDLIYISAYFLMGIALIQLASTALSLKSEASKSDKDAQAQTDKEGEISDGQQ